MATTSKEDIELIFIIVTMGMILMAMGIVVFFFLYQQRMNAKKSEMVQVELGHQKELMTAVIATKENEQRRIALELHDDVGSTLTAIKFKIPNLQIQDSERDILMENLNDAIQRVRRISNELLPSILEELGFAVAVKSLINGLNENTAGIIFRLQKQQALPTSYNKEVELAFYRVLQELLNNILKYSQATETIITINQTTKLLEMVVVDNGFGFVPADHRNKERPSLGLKNMESRVQQIQGKMTYEKLERGTKVTVTWSGREEQ